MSHESHKQVSAFDAKTHLSALIRKVEEGQSFTITRRGSPVANLEPVNQRSDDVHELLARFQAVRQRVKGNVDIRALIDEGRKY
ncbi:type II toxin-antitoxin system prevent-host-death family antitoxin [Mariprofundus ferrooxydans]|nr:type II toxin-antitoxin system prevent-host-death family antitoxin [Mariprofundus ferrooxydans]